MVEESSPKHKKKHQERLPTALGSAMKEAKSFGEQLERGRVERLVYMSKQGIQTCFLAELSDGRKKKLTVDELKTQFDPEEVKFLVQQFQGTMENRKLLQAKRARAFLNSPICTDLDQKSLQILKSNGYDLANFTSPSAVQTSLEALATLDQVVLKRPLNFLSPVSKQVEICYEVEGVPRTVDPLLQIRL